MGATYRTIKVGMWHDSWVDSLEPQAKLYWVWLLTNEHTEPCGIWEMKPGIGAFELGLDHSLCIGYREAFQSAGKAYFEGSWVYIVGYVRHQPNSPPSVWGKMKESVLEAPDNIAKMWLNTNEDIIRNLDGDNYNDTKEDLLEAMDRLSTGCQQASRTEHEHEQETETEQSSAGDGDEISADLQNLAMKVYGHVPGALCQWVDHYPPPWIPMAIERTEERAKNDPSYTKGILENWREQGGPDGDGSVDGKTPKQKQFEEIARNFNSYE